MEIRVTGTFNLTAEMLTNTKQVVSNEVYLQCDTTAPVIINLPAIAGLGGFKNLKIFIVDEEGLAATNNITVNADAADTINTATTALINVNKGVIELQIVTEVQWMGQNVNADANSSIVTLGTITFETLNAAAAAAAVAFTFAATKPAGKYVKRVFVKLTTAFESVTRTALFGAINFGSNTAATQVDLASASGTQMDLGKQTGTGGGVDWKVVQDAFVNLTFGGGGNNPQDYSAGSATIFAEVANWPTL